MLYLYNFLQERQERLRSLEVMGPCMVGKGVGVEVPEKASSGYIINLVREEDEEAVRIPPSISLKLKPHQVSFLTRCSYYMNR